jgi:hypothetical protein
VAPVPLRLRRSAPRGEAEVLRLHMPQVGLGSPHKNAETITPFSRRDYGPAHTAGVWGPVSIVV